MRRCIAAAILPLALALSLGAASQASAQTAHLASPRSATIHTVSSSATDANLTPSATVNSMADASLTVHRAIPRWRAYLYAIDHEKGCWYVWGGNGPCWAGYDCSGLVVAAYASVGIHLPRTTWEMLADWNQIRPVPMSQAKAGDLIFMYGGGHVELWTNWARAGDAFGAHSQGTLSGFDSFSNLYGVYRVVGAG